VLAQDEVRLVIIFRSQRRDFETIVRSFRLKKRKVYFGERHGAIKLWNRSDGVTRRIGQLNVFTGPEERSLGLALDSGFTTNHWLYVSIPRLVRWKIRVSRFRLEHDRSTSLAETHHFSLERFVRTS
jgi:hypothetical protein